MKLQLPWIGKAAGSSAGTIFQTYWGRSYSRSFPAIFHYPNTPAQQKTQAAYYDIRSSWQPIYNAFSKLGSLNQRTNKNSYNLYFRAVIQVLNPYNVEKYTMPPRYFGMDPRNRVVISVADAKISIEKNSLTLFFSRYLTKIGIHDEFNRVQFLAFNRTRQKIAYFNHFYRPEAQSLRVSVDSSWTVSDEIYVYLAFTSPNWLGNFNLVKL